MTPLKGPILEISNDTNDEEANRYAGEEPEESAEAELGQFMPTTYLHSIYKGTEQLSKDWNSPVYVFFMQTPSIAYIKDHCIHVFECTTTHCMCYELFPTLSIFIS